MNQQQDREDAIQTRPLTGVPLSGEQAEATKAGAGSGSSNTAWFVPNKVEIITVER